MLTLPMLVELFDSFPFGVIVLNRGGEVVGYNRAEERMASRGRASVIGRAFFTDVAPCLDIRNFAGKFHERIGLEPLDVEIDASFASPFCEHPREVHLKLTSFEVGTDVFACLVLEDVSTRRAVERMKETLQDLLVHDLKNPLTAVLANLDYLSGIPALLDLKGAREALDDTSLSAQRLQGMVLNLLDITRLETRTMPLHRRPAQLGALTHEACLRNRTLARRLGVDLQDTASANAVIAQVDPAVMGRALDNLIDNALRFSHRVTVRASEEGDQALIEVEDDGPGVPSSERESIFEKYAQAGNMGDGRSHNRGLGLTFVRLVARAHGGEVRVDCPTRGGSIFSLRLPRLLPQDGREA